MTFTDDFFMEMNMIEKSLKKSFDTKDLRILIGECAAYAAFRLIVSASGLFSISKQATVLRRSSLHYIKL